MAFKIPYVYNYIIKLFGQYAEVIQNHENEMFTTMDKAKHAAEKYKRHILGGGHLYGRSSV
jgi:hypothetical protein